MKVTLEQQNILEIEELLKDVSYRHAKPIIQYLAVLAERQKGNHPVMTPMPSKWNGEDIPQ